MEPMYPAISSSVAGPLGIYHLPRLWLKILAHAAGRLPDGYRHGEGGFDEAFCTHFGIDRAAFVTFVETSKPDYQATERWVSEHATNVTPEKIAEFNARILNQNMGDENAAKSRTRFNIADHSMKNAVALNNLDDWAGLHATLTRTG